MWFVDLIQALAWPVTVVIVAFGFKSELLAVVPRMLKRITEVGLPAGAIATAGPAFRKGSMRATLA